MKDVKKSSGNVFADLQVTKPAEALAKAQLARQIVNIIKERGLTQTQAAKILGVDQAKVSALSRGRLSGFSTDRLFRFLNALGQDVKIVVRKKTQKQGQSQAKRGTSGDGTVPAFGLFAKSTLPTLRTLPSTFAHDRTFSPAPLPTCSG